jgi:uncharacterized protein YgiM (DUF1202 family)
LAGILILAALACNAPTAAPVPPAGVVDGVAASQTSLALTQAALGVNPPPAAGFTATITSTPTITFTPTITPTGTPSVPMVSVSTATNCRTGPGVVYDYLDALLVGEKAEVIGKYTSVSPNYWIIKKGSITCWLWGRYATVEGNTANLQEWTPPPTPTPVPTDTPTPTPTTPPAAGDMYIIELFLSTQFEVVARVGTLPIGSLSGNHQYTVYSNGSQVAQGTCTVPSGSIACWSGYKVTGVETIQFVIDSNNAIAETNEGNNTMTNTCDKFTLICN